MRKFSKLFSLMAAITLLMVSKSVWADDAKAAATPAAPTVTVGGMVDGYYTLNVTNNSNSAAGMGSPGIFFNSADEDFALGLAEVDVTATQGGASGHLSLDYGQEGSLGIGGAPGINVLQAYVSYNADQWTFNMGRFATWMGNEVIQSKANMNYSRSFMFWYTIPLWHQGLSVAFNPDSKLGITGYITNGWNNAGTALSGLTNGDLGKTYGLQLAIHPDASTAIILNGIIGPNGAVAPPYGIDPADTRMVAELIASIAASDKLSLALDAEYGVFNVSSTGGVLLNDGTTTATSLPFFGVDLYGRYQIESDWAIALRLEELKDSDNSLGIYTPQVALNDVELRSGTLTIEHNFTPALLVRLESRLDMAYSGGTQYTSATTLAAPIPGPFAGGNGTQFSETLGAVFSF